MVQDVSLVWWAILATTPVPLLVGAAWYSPIAFAKAWMKRTGLRDEELAGARGLALGLGSALLAGFLLSWVLATTLAFAETRDAWEGMLGAFFCWLGFLTAPLLTNDLMERRPASLWLLNAAYWLVVFVVDGAVLGAWR